MSNQSVCLESTDVDSICGRLGSGEVLLLPTDTVYGLCCDPQNQAAIDRVLAIKGRGPDVPMAVLVSGWNQARFLAAPDARLEAMDNPDWPSTLTVVVPRLDTSLLGIGLGEDTVGLRRPRVGLIADVVRRFGPLCATSANRHGQAPRHSVSGVLEDLFADGSVNIDAYVDGQTGDTVASTVVEVHERGWTVLRTGETDPDVIETLMGPRDWSD